jgi:predicted DNA-binding transcriptional regulator YafY
MRDLAELKDIGVPIESDRGRGGGIRLNGRWGLGRLQLSSVEVISLLLALVVSEKMKSPLFLNDMTSIKNRISSAFPTEQQKKIEQLRSRVYIGDNSSDKVNANYTPPKESILPIVYQCFIDLRKMEIEYSSDKGELTRRIIEPQLLLLSWPIWYLVSWDELREGVRMFRIDRISSAQILQTNFSIRSLSSLLEGDLSSYFKQL